MNINDLIRENGRKSGHCQEILEQIDNYEPKITEDFKPTEFWAGTIEKVQVLAERLEKGFPL